MAKVSMQDILMEDLKDAKTTEYVNVVLAPGKYNAQILEFVEKDTFNYVSVMIDGKKHNFFYNYTLKDSDVLNADVLNWMKALATIQTTPKTPFLEITNSSIGSTYEIEVYNYVSKTGKNAGKTQDAINFRELPVLQTVDATVPGIDVVEDDLPF